MEKNHSSSGFPPAVERTLQILDLYAADPEPKTLKYIAEQLQIPASSLYRIINCMQKYNYIVEEPFHPNYFKLGYKLSQFSSIAFSENDLIKLARPFMEELTHNSNQASQLCILSENYICTIDQCLPRSAITYISELGEKLPVNVSASGKLLTALLPPQKQEAFLKRAEKVFRRNTPYTIIDSEKLRKEFEKIRYQKYSTDVEEYAIGIGCLAVPIYHNSDMPIAALGVTGPISFYRNTHNFNTILERLRYFSKKLEELLPDVL